MVAAVQRRLQEDATLARLWPNVTGSFMHAASLDLSGALLDAFLADAPQANPWYLPACVKAYDTYRPGTMPADFEGRILPAFREMWESKLDGTASIDDIPANRIKQSTPVVPARCAPARQCTSTDSPFARAPSINSQSGAMKRDSSSASLFLGQNEILNLWYVNSF